MLAAMLLAAVGVAPLVPGEAMPALAGETLGGKRVSLPAAAGGRVALVALGFSYDSRFAVERWAGEFRREFGSNAGVTFFEVPMMGGVARLGKWFIQSGMRRGTAVEDHGNVITVWGGTDAWKERMRYGSPDAAYLLLVDQEGVVRWIDSGPFDEAKYAGMARQARALLAGRRNQAVE